MVMTERIPVDELLTEARQAQVSRAVVLTLILGIFWGIGWLAGHFVLGLAVCAVSVRRGWRDGRHGTGYVPVHQAVPQSR